MSYHSNPTYVTKAPPKKLQIVLVNAIHNNKAYLLEVSYWLTVIELKAKIEKVFAVPEKQQRLFYQSQELLENNFSLSSFGGRKKIKLILRPTPSLENTLGLVKKYETLPPSEQLEAMLFSVQEGFNLGLVPKLTFNGTSGSYFLRNKYRKTIGVFKPFDEEPFAPNNPKEYKGTLGMQGFRKGILSGESAIREVSAFLLDEKGFSGVPATTFVEIIHPYFSNRDMKEIEITEIKQNPIIPVQGYAQYTDPDKKLLIKHGSLQKFIEDAEEASDFSSKLFPDSEVRKIALLDLRILNCDRNEGNILIKKEKGELRLTPIDHGLSFPDCFDACTYDVVWMEWGHVKKKWTPAEISYIKRIDPKGDVDRLSKHFKFRDICLRNFRIAETVLKKCALAGLTLYDIGTIMYKEDPDFPSPIEELVAKTEEFYDTMVSSMPKEVFLQLVKTDKKNEERKRKSFEEEYKDNMAQSDQGMHSSLIMEHLNLTSDNIHNLIKTELNKEQNENKLFVIPEVRGHHSSHTHVNGHSHTHTNAGTPGLVPKRQSIGHRDSSIKVSSEIDSSKGGGSDRDSSSGDERGHTDDEKGTIKLRRASSIPTGLRRKVSSDAEVQQDDDGSPEKQKCKVLFDKKRNLLNKAKKKKIPPQNDEIFFRYFECFLDQKIDLMTKARQIQPNRGRFKSEV